MDFYIIQIAQNSQNIQFKNVPSNLETQEKEDFKSFSFQGFLKSKHYYSNLLKGKTYGDKNSQVWERSVYNFALTN